MPPASLHRGAIEGLVGQLAFDHEVAGIRTVALPVVTAPATGVEDLSLAQLAFIVHEAFHQDQRVHFDDTDTPAGDFDITVRDVMLAAGAGHVVPLLGDIMRMPGQPASPQAERLDLVDGVVMNTSGTQASTTSAPA